MEPAAEFTGDAYQSEPDVPQVLGDALELFTADDAMREVLGRRFCRTYELVKQTEYNGFLQVISPWEREHLLLNV